MFYLENRRYGCRLRQPDQIGIYRQGGGYAGIVQQGAEAVVMDGFVDDLRVGRDHIAALLLFKHILRLGGKFRFGQVVEADTHNVDSQGKTHLSIVSHGKNNTFPPVCPWFAYYVF